VTVAAGPRAPEPPLFVDLDGTLLKTDLLIESALVLIKRRPGAIVLVLLWLLRGRAYLEAQIARRAEIAAETLVYDERLLVRLRGERDRGRRLVLATASQARYAEAIAAHLGLFDGVLASDATRSLAGERKLEAIVADADGASFDYAGNAAADLPLWRKARKAICVDAPAPVVRALREFTEPDEIAPERRSYLKLLVRAIRAHQWLKNALVFVPIMAAHRIDDAAADLRVIAAVVAFCLCASSVYVLNDLMDLRADRLHPRKRKRPFASGALPLAHGLVLSPLLLAASAVLAALALPRMFLVVLAAYYVSSIAYNFAAKELAVWDVILLAGLYVVRVVAGATAVPVPLSFWLLAFSGFVFLSLALAKRYSEMYTLHKLGRVQAHGRGYMTDDMPILQTMGVASGYLAVLVMALYINSSEIHNLYVRPYALWAICPLLMFWISRIWVTTHRGQMHDDPVVYALRDGVSLVIGALTIACVVLGALRI
jgi:4-hydroxybenzoate polyprenyltransferase/phosphoserine phosphatase